MMPIRPSSPRLPRRLFAIPLIPLLMLSAAATAESPAPADSEAAASASKAAPPVVAWEVAEEPGVEIATWASGLDHPWSLAFLPDGRALVSERPGRLRLIDAKGRAGAPLSGVPEVLALGQGGLLDIALHPDFARNARVYFTYASGTAEANGTALGVGRLSGNGLHDVRQLFVNPSPKQGGQHFGSRLLFLPDATLLMSVGDGGNPPLKFAGKLQREQAQNPALWFGKLLRLTDDGKPAPGNPGQRQPDSGWDAHVYTMGHRNIQGLARDSRNGRLWLTEHGARGGDELNRIRAGANYGWPLVTWGVHYDGSVIANETSRPGLADPVSVWKPSIAPSGLAVYRGDAFPALQGALLAGGLMSKDVRVIRLDSEGRAIRETRIPIDARVRDVRVGPDGLIYVLTDETEGRILRLSPVP